jgi:hypothetical protein
MEVRLYARPQPPDSCGSNAARAFGTASRAALEPARDAARSASCATACSATVSKSTAAAVLA